MDGLTSTPSTQAAVNLQVADGQHLRWPYTKSHTVGQYLYARCGDTTHGPVSLLSRSLTILFRLPLTG